MRPGIVEEVRDPRLGNVSRTPRRTPRRAAGRAVRNFLLLLVQG
jgi:hypothetical protein